MDGSATLVIGAVKGRGNVRGFVSTPVHFTLPTLTLIVGKMSSNGWMSKADLPIEVTSDTSRSSRYCGVFLSIYIQSGATNAQIVFTIISVPIFSKCCQQSTVKIESSARKKTIEFGGKK